MNKMFKKITAAAIACIMTVGMTAFADFSDLPDDPATQTALLNASANGLLNGFDDNTIRPYETLTRAQMGAILARAFNVQETADLSGFGDMKPEQWYYQDMSKAVAMGAFQGDGKNLNPESKITFQEAFTVLSRIFDLKQLEYVYTDTQYDAPSAAELLVSQKEANKETITEEERSAANAARAERQTAKRKAKDEATNAAVAAILAKYPDGNQVASWACFAVASILNKGYWQAETIRPTEHINRAEFAVLMNNMVSLYINEPGTYSNLPANGNIVVRANDVTISGGQTAGSIIFADSTQTGTVAQTSAEYVVIRGGRVSVNTCTLEQVRMTRAGVSTIISNDSSVKLVYGPKGSLADFGTIM